MICQLLVLLVLINTSAGMCADIKECFPENTNDAVIFVESIKGDVIYSRNIKRRFVPASTIKILTALVALHFLGEDFRFKTEFYVDKDRNLKIKGYGDPFLISEILDYIAKSISKKILSLNNIIVDDSYFSKDIKIYGTGNSFNPYDAPVGALCANFNTIYIRVRHGKIMSAEPQTPLIPFALTLIKHINRGGRYVISHDIKESERYAAELFRYFLSRYGVNIKGRVKFGHVNKRDRLIYTYYSRLTLKEVIKNMMKYSNNFIANQIMLVLGAEIYGPPASLNKGVSVIREYAKYNLGIKDIKILEGSGISRKNHISCIDMAIILKRFKPYMRLLKNKGNIYYKTGTLKGISTRAGYIIVPQHGTYIFVLSFKGLPQHKIDHIMKCIADSIRHL